LARRPKPPAPPLTEKFNPRGEDLDTASTAEIVRRLHAEDRAAVEAVAPALREIARAADLAARALACGGRLIYAGAGTSGRLGVLDAAECPPTFGIRPSQVVAIIAGGRRALTRAVEGAEDDRRKAAAELKQLRLRARDVVCAVSASARTPYALGALEAARRAGAATVLVCNSPPPSGELADVVVLARTGPELVAGSTRLKAGTATKLILNAISTAAMVRLGKVFRGRMVDLQPRNQKLRERAERILAELTGLPIPEARELLARAGGKPKLALAMYLTGLPRTQAERKVREVPLRELASAPAGIPRARGARSRGAPRAARAGGRAPSGPRARRRSTPPASAR